jgi:predicted N-acetyltransferase YhbS
VAVRRATRSDVHEIAELLERADLPPSVRGFRSEIARLRRRDPELLLTALAHGRIVGVIAGSYDGRTAMVSRLVVDPQHRRQGIGSRLVEELCAELAKLGASSDALIVLDEGAGTGDFWASVGFDHERSAPYMVRRIG